MDTCSISLPLCLVLNNPGIYLFGKPMIGICTQQRFSVSLSSVGSGNSLDGKTDVLFSVVQQWVKNKYPDIKINNSVRYSFSYMNPIQNINFPYIHKDVLAIGIARVFLKRALQSEEIQSLLNILHPRKDLNRLFTLMSVHGGISFVRKEFEFLQQAAFFKNHIPSKWDKQLLLLIPNHTDCNTDLLEWYCERYKYLYHRFPKKTEMVLKESERATKQFLLAIHSENKPLFIKSFRGLAATSGYGNNNFRKYTAPFLSENVIATSVFLSGRTGFLCYTTNKEKLLACVKQNSYRAYPVRSDSDGIRYETW